MIFFLAAFPGLIKSFPQLKSFEQHICLIFSVWMFFFFFFFFNGQVLKVIKKLHPLSWIMPVSAEPGRESRAAASLADT